MLLTVFVSMVLRKTEINYLLLKIKSWGNNTKHSTVWFEKSDGTWLECRE
jgi:hypothetical protein